MLAWSLIPLNIRSAYIPDPAASPAWSLPPVWDQNGEEPAAGANQGNNDYDTLPNWYEDHIGTDRFNPDTDGDSITDSDELSVSGTNPLDGDSDDNGWTDYEDWSGQSQATADPDGDGASNLAEITAGSNPRSPDSDGDGLGDGIEFASAGAYSPVIADTDANGVSDYHQYYGLTPPPPPQTADSDSDGLPDDQEAAHGASPSVADTDGDTLLDGAEVAWGSSPASGDTDGDGAADPVEASLSLLPNDPDTDDDGLTDGFEIAHNGGATYQPNDPDSNDDGYTDYQDYTGQTLPPPPADADNDGLLDEQEAAHGSNPADADTDDDTLADGLEVSWGSSPLLPDTDGDAVNDAAEYALGLQPANPDSDGDSLSDGYEALTSGTSASSADSDEDGLRDDYELLLGNPATSPLDPDTDDDFLTDFEEVNAADSFTGFTQPLSPVSADSDGDQISDYLEVAAFLQDGDGGGIPDRIERFYGLSPGNPADDTGDLDGDGWTNLQEYQAGHSLNADFSSQFDWDVDGMTNVWEIAHGLNPNDHHDAAEDPDGDWRPNLEEFRDGYDPNVADSGNPGITPEGQALAADGDGSEWDADWDQDGTSNLDELLDDETDPTDPDPEPCPCGGNQCGCSETGQCSSSTACSSCSCGGNACSCGNAEGCTAQCNANTICTCDGNACECLNTGECSSQCNATIPCGCDGDICGCSEQGQCSTQCQSCSCGGDNCSCAQAGCCTEPCNQNMDCTCGGSICSCTSTGQCSYPCEPVGPCQCSYSASGLCSCSDADDCSNDCYTPPLCSCQWVNNGCTCSNSSQCSGDCVTDCMCNDVGFGCECTYNGECNGNCAYNPPCTCGYSTTGDCPCQADGECNGDCYTAPCNCEQKQQGQDCPCQSDGECENDCVNELGVDISGSDSAFVDKNTSYTATVTTGQSPFTYNWDLDGGEPATSASETVNVSWSDNNTKRIKVTVTDANGKKGSKTKDIKVHKITSSTVEAPDPRDRTKIGIGEKVNLYCYCDGSPVTTASWEITNQGAAAIAPNSFGALLSSADQTGDIEVKATIGTASSTITFNAITPTGITGQKINPETIKTPPYSKSYMEIRLTLEPTDVSFRSLYVKEFDGGSSSSNYPHTTAGNDIAVGGGNVLMNTDTVSGFALGPADLMFTWTCEWKWKYAGYGQYNDIPGSPFNQDFYYASDVDGSTHIIVDKFGCTIDNGWSN